MLVKYEIWQQFREKQSDIDVRIPGVGDIDSGGRLSDELRKLGGKYDIRYRWQGVTYDGPELEFKANQNDENNPEMKYGPQNGIEFLSTGTSCDPFDLMSELDSERIVLIGIMISPKDSYIGYLSEKNNWIHSVWDRTIKEYPNIKGCRVSWDMLFFYLNEGDVNFIKEKLIQIMRENDDKCVEGICVVKDISGNLNVKCRILDDIFNELVSKSRMGGQNKFQYGNNYIDEAKQCWSKGDILAAGCILYENMEMGLRPQWATQILSLVAHHMPQVRDIPYIEEIFMMARDPNRWVEAYDLFNHLRDITNSERDPIKCEVMVLAEDVTKVMYNLSDPVLRASRNYPALFDYDAGWWIPYRLKRIIDLVGDAEMKSNAWPVLVGSAPEYKIQNC